MSKKHVRVAVKGAAGQIGYALIFRIASGQMFGPDVDVSLNLIELTQALGSLEGVRMELEDCAFDGLKEVVVTDDLHLGFQSVDWAILVGAMPRKAGMERADLLEKNASIFSAQGAALNAVAHPEVRVLVVGNPCNTNALIAMKHAPALKPSHFYAMTMLDENRARSQLALKAGVPVSSVQNTFIWGNHSATQFPDYAHASMMAHLLHLSSMMSIVKKPSYPPYKNEGLPSLG